jgi:hypothetical protein
VDLNHYDRMVSGVDACVTYASNEAKGIKTMKATYEVSALKMGVKYYVEHQYGPLTHTPNMSSRVVRRLSSRTRARQRQHSQRHGHP